MTVRELREENERLRRLLDTIRYMIEDPDVLNMIDETYPKKVGS